MVTPFTLLPLGDTGLAVSKLSLGTVKFGRDQGVRYPTPVKIPTDAEILHLLQQAAEMGINLLDTAPAYGNSEERLGNLLGKTSQRWLICTKVGEEYADGVSSHNFSPEHCRMSVERSLQRLNVEVLDIVLIHSDGNDIDILQKQGTLQALQALKQAGKIRAVGMSHKSREGGELALNMGADVMMATLNRSETDDAALIKNAAAGGCGVLIKKALSSGHGSSADLTFVAQHEGVHSIVVGTTSANHLRENVEAINAAG
ncbi:MAG: aldo/keto reductase [Pseudomonadaceae bacterium]|nr:aldo/keto reductase [Pseudomonadaceae bacterium]